MNRVIYFNDKYREVVNLSFQGAQIKLKDHTDEVSRRCRFCQLGKPNVTFRNDAHAVPEFLGNKAIISLNECDDCNTLLADNYEDHLGKWSMFIRALAHVKGKCGFPTFKNPEIRPSHLARPCHHRRLGNDTKLDSLLVILKVSSILDVHLVAPNTGA